MKICGGVIIIGSLKWEDNLELNDNLRKDWRTKNLNEEEVSLCKLPIRYGRESSKKRSHTYTMVFSEACEKKIGQGLILPFNKDVEKFDDLKNQAIEMARAEGIYKSENLKLTCVWGAMGLMINPKLKTKDGAVYKLLVENWSALYAEFFNVEFKPHECKAEIEKQSPIDEKGFLKIKWQPEMDNFDVLISTVTVPKPKQIFTAKEIAQRMIDQNYTHYFSYNLEHKIFTSDDSEIKQHLKESCKH